MDIPTIIKGEDFTDYRGSMRFVNNFIFGDVQRLYFKKHHDIATV